MTLAVSIIVLLAFIIYFQDPGFVYAPILTKGRIAFYHDILTNNNDYYLKLSGDGRKKFIQRLHKFKCGKNFYAKGEFALEEKHKVLISSAAIQITFGLEDFTLDHFHTITIYPSKFRLFSHQQEYKGLTGQHGMIFLSWEDFVAGYKTKEDKINLGIHEMAHSLELNAIIGDKTTMDFALKYDEWKAKSMEEYERIRNDEDSFLRDYAGASEREFFAVCVEYFFEDPSEFDTHLPEIYQYLRLLLNQDPTNTQMDYQLLN